MARLQTAMLPVLHARPVLSGIKIGRVVGRTADGAPLVDYPGNAFGPVAARVTASVPAAAVRRALTSGGDVLLAFGGKGAAAPVLFDVVRLKKRRPVAPSASAPPATPTPAAPVEGAACLGRIVAAEGGTVFVDFDGNAAGPLPARTTVPLRNLKDPVLLQLLSGGLPVIVGQLYDGVPLEAEGGAGADVVLKGRTVRIEAEAEVVLIAGGSQIRLDARGRVVTTADQVVSRARGANRVQGACVQLN